MIVFRKYFYFKIEIFLKLTPKYPIITMMKIPVLLLAFLCLVSGISYSQTPTNAEPEISSDSSKTEKRLLNFGGYTSLSYEFYDFESDDASFRGRKPKHLARLIANPTLDIGKYWNLSAQIMISSQATNFLTPVDHYRGQYNKWYGVFSEFESFGDFLDYFSNPINRLNFSPSYRGQKLYLGTHTPKYTKLTQGNISLFGVGAEFQSEGTFFFNASYGFTQPAIEQDTSFNIMAAYRRRLTTFRLGIGNESKTFIAFNVVDAKDQLTSLEFRPDVVNPKAGFTTSMDFGLKIGKHVTLKSEAATSFITENRLFFEDASKFLSDDIREEIESEYNSATQNFLPDLLDLNPSTRVDWAAEVELGLEFGDYGLSTNVLYVGPGYKTFGYPFFISDRAELTLSPRISFLQKRVNFFGTFGRRIIGYSKRREEQGKESPTISIAGNEGSILSNNKIASTSQNLISANLNIQATNALSFDVGYSNFGIQNVVENDTFKILNVAQNFSLTPVYTRQGKTGINVFSGMISYDDFEDFNVVTGALNDNQSKIASFSYTYSGVKRPLTLGMTFSYADISSTQFSTSNNSLTLLTGYKFFDKKLNLTLNLTGLKNINENDFAGFQSSSDNTQFLFKIQAGYKVRKRLSLSLMAGNNQFYKSLTSGATGTAASQFSEINIRVRAIQRF